jgi:hypothetical protein
MGDPNTPAPLEDIAVKYIAAGMASAGGADSSNATIRNVQNTYYRGLYRGLMHFFLDHLLIPPDAVVEKYIDGSPIDVIDYIISNEDGAWENE